LYVQVLLLLDADFIASAGLHEFLTQDDKAADLMEDLTANRKIIVLPAFETEASLGVQGGGDMALKGQASKGFSTLLPQFHVNYAASPQNHRLGSFSILSVPLYDSCVAIRG